MNNYIFKILLIIFFFLIPLVSFAQPHSDDLESSTGVSNSVPINNPLGENTTPESIIGNVINAVLGISGSLALLMFVYGGFTWMLSGGSPEKVTKGKNTLVWATIGLVVIFSSYALVNFVFKGLGSATGG